LIYYFGKNQTFDKDVFKTTKLKNEDTPMAIYHFSGQVISRSQGRSAVASSAYRAGLCIEDERTGIMHDYTRKQDVVHTEILLPENAPAWMGDRATLWNRVEAGEKRKDAQLAREFNISLPRELTNAQNIELAREFVQTEFVARGMVADVAIHNHAGSDGEMQPHAHVMLTMREITPDGFGQKVREWNDKNLLLELREAWGETANRHLFFYGHDQTIDHRRLSAQGIALEPQHKIGAVAAHDKLARLADHQRIAFENGERILADPTIALNAITHQQSTFTHQDLARFVNRHTLDADQFQTVFDAVRASPELVALGQDEKGRNRFSTQTMVALENRLVTHADTMHQRHDHHVPIATQTQILSRYTLSDQQRDAFQHLTERGDIKCVVGYAGTGKSYLLGAAREAWEAQGYRVHGATLSGIAAQNLSHSSGIASRTLASRFYYWDKNEQPLTSRDILVVDEAGMIGSRSMAKLLHQAHEANAKVVFVGDPQQLQAIEAGAAFRALLERTGYVELTDIRRQREPWQQTATKELARGDVALAIDRYDKHDHLHAFETRAEAKNALIEHWNDARISNPQDTHILLAYTRKDVQELNTLARDLRSALGELGKEEHAIQTERGARTFSEQDRLYFLQNDRNMGVMNGTLGTIQTIDTERNCLTVKLDPNEREKEPRTITVNLDSYANIDHGYAATVHKSQGVTVDRGYLLASRHLDAHATYVGLSRHRESADVFWSKEDFKHEQDLSRSLGREQHKDMSIDYLDSASRERNSSYKHDRSVDETHKPTEQYAEISRRTEEFLTKQETLQHERHTGDTQAFTNPYEKGHDEEAINQRFAQEIKEFKQEYGRHNENIHPRDMLQADDKHTTRSEGIDDMSARLHKEMKDFKQDKHDLREHDFKGAPDHDLDEFKKSFEKENPSLAKSIQKEGDRGLPNKPRNEKEYDRGMER
jgi:Ti-type conjugative transfer relaxase TraA